MFYPMFALVIFTYSILLVNLYWRVQAVRKKQVPVKYFSTFEAGGAPEHIVAGTRHYANLFELPVLFYVAGAISMALNLLSPLLLTLGWLFVGCRVIHAAIHMSYNNVFHRAIIFWVGSMVVLAMWVVLLINYRSLA